MPHTWRIGLRSTAQNLTRILTEVKIPREKRNDVHKEQRSEERKKYEIQKDEKNKVLIKESVNVCVEYGGIYWVTDTFPQHRHTG